MSTGRRAGRGGRTTRPLPGPRTVDPAARDEVRALIGTSPRSRDMLLELLHLIQDRYGEIRHRHLAALCDELRISLAEGFEVATFYARLDVVPDDSEPRSASGVRVCDGLPCLLAGARALTVELRSKGVPVATGPCIGQCDAAPAAEVGRRVVRSAAAADVDAALIENGLEPLPPYASLDAYVRGGGYALLRSCLAGEREPLAVIAQLEAAGLRGLGGAGFPTGRKWRIVRGQPGPRFVALNADEGEPGTFKDRWCLERDPHRVLEGMLLACWSVGADDAYVYLRDEYAVARAILTKEIRALAASGASPVRIHMRRGAGAYVCGEESAMLESIEGRRGYPRHRPPFAAEVGLFGRPTLIQNVETMYWVREILEQGVDRWRSHGRHGRTGRRLFSLSGRVRRPGSYAADAGITARELIEEHGGGMAEGHRFAAYLPGGAAGGILPASLSDVSLDFDALQPHGAFIGSAGVIVLSDEDDVREVARELMRFFAHESCGQCTPCRVGTDKAVQLLAGPSWDVPLLRDLSAVMADGSICGLGQAAPNPVLSVLRHWPETVAGPRPEPSA